MSAPHRLYKILVTHPEVPKVALELLHKNNCETIACESIPTSRAEIISKLPAVDAIFWGYYDPLDAEILDAAGKQLKAVSTMSSGIDFVDVEEFKRRQMPLGHTPGVVKDAVADLAVGLMVSAARHFHAGRQQMENARWHKTHIMWLMGQEVRGSVVGFYGFGGIGQAIVKRLQGWEAGNFIYHTRRQHDNPFGALHVPFEQLLQESDFLIFCCPLTPETRNKFNAEAFKQMKRNCVFVNVARGYC